MKRVSGAKQGAPMSGDGLDSTGRDGPGSTDASTDLPDRLLKGRLYGRLFPSVPAPSARIGRFVLLSELGHGGMGRVFAAYDESLDRKVAIKLLHADTAHDDKARARLLREAKALARLSHPNVVQVHEAGMDDEQVYLVMEHIEGTTLRGWIEEQAGAPGRSRWPAVLDLMMAAGEGLCAAHQAGLLHRDFKPDNLLLGSDGRVRIVDFGLAAEARPEAPHIESLPATEQDARRPLEHVTRTGAAVGTVIYMPLEQLQGGDADARSDQFSFCTTLHEALFGVRPFEGATRATLALALANGEPQVPEHAASVPRWLRRAVWRGLATDPQARHPDMRALLLALHRGRRRRRSIAAVGAAATIGIAGMALGLSVPDSTAPCERAGDELAAAWNDTTRLRMRAAFDASGVPHANHAAARIESELDDHVEAWRAEQLDACQDTRVRQTHPPSILGRRTLCIERNTHGLRALLRRLPDADAGLIEHAHQLVSELPSVSRCQDVEALELGLTAPRDPEAVAEIRDHLADVRLLLLVEPQAQVVSLLEHQVERARSLDEGPVLAEALGHLSTALMHDQHYERAEARLWDALDVAERTRHDELVPELWLGMAELADRHRRDPELALQWLRRADATLDRGPDDPHLRIHWLRRAGHARYRAGQLPEAEQLLRHGLELAANTSHSDILHTTILESLALVVHRRGRRAEAEALHDSVQAAWIDQVGPTHPYVARHAFNRGVQRHEAGNLEGAFALLEQARAGWAASGGPQSPDLARALVAMANVAQDRGQLPVAGEYLDRAQQIYSSTVAADHPDRLELEQTLGMLHWRRGQWQPAYDAWQRTIDALGDRDPALTLMLRANQGEALVAMEHVERAREHYRGLFETARSMPSLDAPTIAGLHKGAGLAALGQGRHAEAVEHLEAAQAGFEGDPGLVLERADAQWGLARALTAAAGQAPPRATELARDAAAVYREHGRTTEATTITQWTQHHTSTGDTEQ